MNVPRAVFPEGRQAGLTRPGANVMASLDSDGTWAYLSILDPVIADGDYRVQRTMESKYGPVEG